MFAKSLAHAINAFLCTFILSSICRAELNLNKSIDWLSTQPSAGSADKEEAEAIQVELKRLGCRSGASNGDWRRDAVEQFSRFLAHTREPYSSRFTVRDVLTTLRNYANGPIGSCAPKKRADAASDICSLERVRQEWIVKQDSLFKARLKTEKEKGGYVGLDTLLRSLKATSGNYAALIPQDDDEMQWLRPPKVALSTIRDLMRSEMLDLDKKIKKRINY